MKQRLRVWWIPQVPMKSFNREVQDLCEAKLLLDTLADYDKFQFLNKVKPDYSNTGGIQVFDPGAKNEAPGSEWIDWHPDDTPEFVEVVERLHPDMYSGGDELIFNLSLEQIRIIVAEMNKPKKEQHGKRHTQGA